MPFRPLVCLLAIVALAEAQTFATFKTPNGNYTFTASTTDCWSADNVTISVPGFGLTATTAVTIKTRITYSSKAVLESFVGYGTIGEAVSLRFIRAALGPPSCSTSAPGLLYNTFLFKASAPDFNDTLIELLPKKSIDGQRRVSQWPEKAEEMWAVLCSLKTRTAAEADLIVGVAGFTSAAKPQAPVHQLMGVFNFWCSKNSPFFLNGSSTCSGGGARQEVWATFRTTYSAGSAGLQTAAFPFFSRLSCSARATSGPERAVSPSWCNFPLFIGTQPSTKVLEPNAVLVVDHKVLLGTMNASYSGVFNVTLGNPPGSVPCIGCTNLTLATPLYVDYCSTFSCASQSPKTCVSNSEKRACECSPSFVSDCDDSVEVGQPGMRSYHRNTVCRCGARSGVSVGNDAYMFCRTSNPPRMLNPGDTYSWDPAAPCEGPTSATSPTPAMGPTATATSATSPTPAMGPTATATGGGGLGPPMAGGGDEVSGAPIGQVHQAITAAAIVASLFV